MMNLVGYLQSKFETRRIEMNKEILKKKVKSGLIVHFICAILFMVVYSIPFIFAENQTIKDGLGMFTFVGIILILAPTLINTLIWTGIKIKKIHMKEAFVTGIWILINLALTLLYLMPIMSIVH